MNLKPGLILILIFTFWGCATTPVKTPEDYIKRHQISDFDRSNFPICYSYGCQEKATAFFTQKDWQAIKNIFTPAPEDAQSERQFIAKAIQSMEIIVGEKTGTNQDIGGTFTGMFKQNQMDCEDEAVNTNIFLILLQQDNLMRFHSFYGIARRGMIINGWPHVACSIVETAGTDRYVLDSWFTDHGMTVYVVSEQIWKSGWNPPKDN